MSDFYDLPFAPLALVDDVKGSSFFGGPCRILGFNRTTDTVWYIECPRNRPQKEHSNKMRSYVKKPQEKSLKLLSSLFEGSKRTAIVLRVKEEIVSDTDLLAQMKNPKDRARVEAYIKHRDKRYDIISPLLRIDGSGRIRTFAEMISDESLPERIRIRAAETECATSQVYALLHRFWAGGSRRNALMPGYPRCGNPGKSKPQNNALGRHSRLYKAGLTPVKGYPLDRYKGADAEEDEESDKQKLAWGYRLVCHEIPPHDAYLVTMASHWATHEVRPDGSVYAKLFPIHLRPTYAQFERWGKKLNKNKSVAQIHMGDKKWEEQNVARGGSVQDMTSAVGQLGIFDGTSNDNYLSSIESRLKKLPPMTRSVLKENRSTVIFGWFLGWESPSPATGLETILVGASSKVPIAARVGITIEEDQIPALLCRNYLVDNGELKAEKPTEAEVQFGIDIEYTPTYSGARKGNIESDHHTVQLQLDHRLSGTTFGKRRERGKDHPAVHALFNFREYLRELILWIVDYNNEEVIDLAPVEMLLKNPEISPTRLNIFKWLRAHGQTAEVPYTIESLRAFMLPEVDAVVRKNGVYLVALVNGRKRLIPKMRFSSPDLVASGLLSAVKSSGKSIPTKLRMAETNMTEAWLPTQTGMIHLKNASPDSSLKHIPLIDWIQFLEKHELSNDLKRGEKEQAAAERVVNRLSTIDHAREEQNAEIEALSRPPTKKSYSANLTRNMKEEMEFLRRQDQQSHQSPSFPADAEANDTAKGEAGPLEYSNAEASDAMDAFNQEEFST